MEVNYTFLTLSPHGNIQHIIEEEQRFFSTGHTIRPFYPLICPVKELTNEINSQEQHLILAEYQHLFQCKKTVFTLEKPCLSGNALYRRLQWNQQDILHYDDIDFNGIKLNTNSFFYGTVKKDLDKVKEPKEVFFKTNSSLLTIKVFRLCIITFTVNENNPLFYTWKEKCSVWTANNNR